MLMLLPPALRSSARLSAPGPRLRSPDTMSVVASNTERPIFGLFCANFLK